MVRFDLNDEELAINCPLLPKQERSPKRKDEKKVLKGSSMLDWCFLARSNGTLWTTNYCI